MLAKKQGNLVFDANYRAQLGALVERLARAQAVASQTIKKSPDYAPYLIQPMNSHLGKAFVELSDALSSKLTKPLV